MDGFYIFDHTPCYRFDLLYRWISCCQKCVWKKQNKNDWRGARTLLLLMNDDDTYGDGMSGGINNIRLLRPCIRISGNINTFTQPLECIRIYRTLCNVKTYGVNVNVFFLLITIVPSAVHWFFRFKYPS